MKLKVANLIFGVLFLVLSGLAIWRGIQPAPYGGVFGKATGTFAGLIGLQNPLKSNEPPRWKWNALTVGGLVGAVAGIALLITSVEKSPPSANYPPSYYY